MEKKQTKAGKLIKERRIALGFTQQQIGDYLGVKKSTVSMWQSGRISNMKRDKIAKLSQILQISPADIINADELEFDAKLNVEQAQLVIAYNAASEETKDIIFRILGMKRPKKEENGNDQSGII